MEWLTILMTLLSFFLSKKSGASNTQAAITAGLVGAGTYYVSHETEWGRANLGALDGVTPSTGTETTTADPVTGRAIKLPTTTNSSTGVQAAAGGVTSLLSQWGATGTAAVIGAAGATTGSGVFKSKWFWPAVIGLGALLIINR